jgi:hypothetical protein
MKAPGINYKALVEASLRSVVRQAMTQVAERGLPGDHHFYITFRTVYPGVDIPHYLVERYPTEMTIVLQHQFEYLDVDESGFSVTLNFRDNPERLVVPFNALTMFADPSVNFALPFQPPEVPAAAPVQALKPAETKPQAVVKTVVEAVKNAPDAQAEGEEKSGEVVSFDKFRKK